MLKNAAELRHQPKNGSNHQTYVFTNGAYFIAFKTLIKRKCEAENLNFLSSKMGKNKRFFSKRSYSRVDLFCWYCFLMLSRHRVCYTIMSLFLGWFVLSITLFEPF